MSRNTLPTIPHWASWTPDTGTAELALPGCAATLPPLGPATPTEPMHLLDLQPFVQPLKQSWNSMLTVAGAIGLVVLFYYVFVVGGRELGWLLLALSGSDAL